MKAALVTDTHFYPYNVNYQLPAWGEFFKRVEAMGIKRVYHGGDLYETHNVTHGRQISLGEIHQGVVEPIRHFVKSGGEFHIINGNHDSTEAGVSALVLLQGLPGVHVHLEPTVLDGGDHNLVLVPWVYHRKRVLNALGSAKNINPSKPSLLLGHLELAGTSINQGNFTYSADLGKFVFSPEELRSFCGGTEAAIRLGHIHKRDDTAQRSVPNTHYIGALTQFSFQFEGDPSGFEVLDTKTMKGTWQEIESPRYLTVKSFDQLRAHGAVRKGDFVRTEIDNVPQDILNDVEEKLGITITAVPQRRDRKIRVEGADEIRDNPLRLFEKWALENKAEIIGKEKLLQIIHSQSSKPVLCQLDRIRSVTIKGLGLNDLKVDFPDGMHVISGDNGIGKTMALEGLIIALYGKVPSKKGSSLSDIVDIDNGGDTGSVEATFDVQGETYTVHREISVSETRRVKKHTAVLMKEGVADPITSGPEPVEQYVTNNLIGDLRLVLATAFYSQDDRAEDFISMPPAKRRDLLMKVFNLEYLAEIGTRAEDHVKILSEKMQVDLELEKRLRENLREVDLLEMKKQVYTMDVELKILRSSRKALQNERAELDETLRGIARYEQTLKLSEDAQQKVQTVEKSLHTSRTKFLGELDNLAELALGVRDKAEETIKQYLQRMDESSYADLAVSIDFFQDSIDTQRKERERFVRIVQESSDRRAKMEAQRSAHILAATKIQGEQNELQARIDRAEKFWKRSEGLPCHELTVPKEGQKAEMKRECPLFQRVLEDAKDASDIKVLREQIQKIDLKSTEHHKLASELAITIDKTVENTQQASGVAAKLQIRIDEMEIKRRTLVAAAEHLKEQEAMRQAAESSYTILKELRRDVSSVKPAWHGDPSTLFDGVSRLSAETNKCGLYSQDVQSNAKAMAAALQEIHVQRAQVSSLESSLKEQSVFAQMIDKADLLRERSQRLQLEDDAYSLQESTLTEQLGGTKARIKAIEKSAKELDEIAVGIEGSKKDLAEWTQVATAFSKKGIPQIVIDSLAPQVENTVNDIFDAAGLAMKTEINTLVESKSDSSTREDLQVLLYAGGSNRPRIVETFSGGQVKMAKIAYRLAFTKIIGKNFKVLAMDEPYRELSDRKATALNQVLVNFSKDFSQLLVTSHSDHLIHGMSGVLNIEKFVTRRREVAPRKKIKAKALQDDLEL